MLVRDPVTGSEHFARVKVPNNVPRFVPVETGGDVRWLPLEELIGANLHALFPGLDVTGHHAFRVTRNADLEVEEDRDADLLQALERELARRRFGPAVRLEVGEDMDEEVLDLLVRELEITPADVVTVPGLLDLTSLWQLYAVDRPELKDDPFVPATHPRLAEGESAADVFAALREGDVLVHHPYDSFATSVQRFVEQAAQDPAVLAIKQTLYRTSGDSPIVRALIAAAEAGKQVVVLVEITARFDEQANITWARALERAGCHVVYGLVGLKTHCKTCLVVRQEKGQLRRYAHLGTGNYNPKTARTYEDLGLLTADPDVGGDLTDLFNTLTGYSRQTEYRTLMVAPHGVRDGLVRRIDAEAEHARAGRPARVRIKANSIVDETIVDALYRASQAGVPVELLVRGICSLRPGVPGLSETMHVRSVLGRFLEHSRVMVFGDGERTEVWMGSPDLMHRNLDRRVETLVRVRTPPSAGSCRPARPVDGRRRPALGAAGRRLLGAAAGARRAVPRPAGRPAAPQQGARRPGPRGRPSRTGTRDAGPGGRRACCGARPTAVRRSPSCTGRATTTGRCPRASSSRASTRSRRRSARSARRPARRRWPGGRSGPAATRSSWPGAAPRRRSTGGPCGRGRCLRARAARSTCCAGCRRAATRAGC